MSIENQKRTLENHARNNRFANIQHFTEDNGIPHIQSLHQYEIKYYYSKAENCLQL